REGARRDVAAPRRRRQPDSRSGPGGVPEDAPVPLEPMELRGVVRIKEEMRVELPWHRYVASWQPDPDGPSETFYWEDGPGWTDPDRGIAWARRRGPIVSVRRREGGSEVHNAGERDDHPTRPTQRWPGARRRPSAHRHPDYGGVVYLDEEQPSLIPTGRFS